MTKPSAILPQIYTSFTILSHGLENPAGPAAASRLALCLPNPAPEALLVLTKAAGLGQTAGSQEKAQNPE